MRFDVLRPVEVALGSSDSCDDRLPLVVPLRINKFYILHPKSKNSFIKWCIDQDHTVLVLSLVNFGPELVDKGLDDNLIGGILQAREGN